MDYWVGEKRLGIKISKRIKFLSIIKPNFQLISIPTFPQNFSPIPLFRKDNSTDKKFNNDLWIKEVVGGD